MAQTTEELIEQCAASVMLGQPGDLRSLGQLHSDLEEVCNRTVDRPAAAAVAGKAAAMVEQIVLGDVNDAVAALEQVSLQVAELQREMKQPSVPVRQSAVVAAAPAAPPVAPTQIPSEKVITEADVPMVVEFVGEALSHLDGAEKSLLKLEEDPTDLNEVNAVFRAFHTIKGVSGFLELKQIGALAHVSETMLDLARKEKIKLHGGFLDVVLEARDAMKQMVSAVDAAANTLAAPGLQPGLEALLSKLKRAAAGEEPGSNSVLKKATTAAATDPSVATTAEATVAATPPAAHAPPTGDATLKVTTVRLDALINTVGELVIAQAMVAQDLGTVPSDQRLARNLSQLGKITRSLQDLSMSMRMVPIAGVFQKMARLVRDTSRKAGKEVELVQLGNETELDRNVVDAISDPLVHMVRNSIDHGVEFPEDREKSGKPRAGKLILKAGHQGGSVVIEITDDGRGLQQEKIVKKAIAAGIVREGQELTEQEIFQLIFHPGLSTAEKLTDISGRGVGMDVVKKNVDALRGRIEIASTPGKGSTFTVRLPLTLAVIDGLIVGVGRERYIVPITSIEQSIRPTAAQLSTVQGKGELCMVRDRLLPIVRLHKLFNIEPRTTDPTKSLVVIVQEGPSRCCLLVDEVIGQQQVVIKSVGKEIGNLPGIAGCAILGDGNVSLILDVAGIIHSAL